jgi:hypothetical protein
MPRNMTTDFCCDSFGASLTPLFFWLVAASGLIERCLSCSLRHNSMHNVSYSSSLQCSNHFHSSLYFFLSIDVHTSCTWLLFILCTTRVFRIENDPVTQAHPFLVRVKLEHFILLIVALPTLSCSLFYQNAVVKAVYVRFQRMSVA